MQIEVEDIILYKSLGKGSFGEVFLTKRKGVPDQIFATKKVPKSLVSSPKVKKYFDNEIHILRQIEHPNIIKFYEIKTSMNNYFLVFEVCNGGGLSQCLTQYQKKYKAPFSEEIVQHFMRQTVAGLQYLHNKKILHRDIKCDNIMVHFPNEEDQKQLNFLKTQVKIIDFGFARYLEEESLAQSVLGSPINMDPLILQKMKKIDNNKSYGYDQKADIWSLGTVCYELLVGVPPFDATSYEDLVHKIQKGNYKIPQKLNLSKQCISFLNGMLQYDTKKRLDINDLARHKFLVNDVKTFEVMQLEKRTSKDMILNTKEEKFSILESMFVTGSDINSIRSEKDIDETITKESEGRGILKQQNDILDDINSNDERLSLEQDSGHIPTKNNQTSDDNTMLKIDDSMEKKIFDIFNKMNKESIYIEPMLLPIVPNTDERLLKFNV